MWQLPNAGKLANFTPCGQLKYCSLPMLPTLDMCHNKSNTRASSTTSIIDLAGAWHKIHLHTDTSWHTPHIGIQPIIIIITTGLLKEFLCFTKAPQQCRHTVLSFLPCSVPTLCSIILARQKAVSRWRRWRIPVSVACCRHRWPITAYYRCLRFKTQEQDECRRRLSHKTLAALI